MLPVAFDTSGARGRPFAEAVDLLDDSPPQGGLGLDGGAFSRLGAGGAGGTEASPLSPIATSG